MNVNHNKKGNNMRSIYIQRRIMVILAMVLIPAAGFFTVKAMGNYVAKPTFTCQPADVRLGHQMIWNIADQHCSGNITDATKQIMEDNGIKGKDLRGLLPSTIIVIKGGN